MIELNMSAGNNSKTIWVLKINTPTPIYAATRDLALDTTFDGQVLNYENYLSDLSFSSSIQNSGGTGSVTSISFSISRYNSNTSLDGFFNEFYPATSGDYLTSQIVQLGVCWVGANADTDITWLFTGRIVDYGYEQRRLNVTVFQESEITNKKIPYYSIQKDFNNGVSYYETVPEDNLGKTVPIIYGYLDERETNVPYVGRFVPIIKYDNDSFLICSHPTYNPFTSSPYKDLRIFEWSEDFETYLELKEYSMEYGTASGFVTRTIYSGTYIEGRTTLKFNYMQKGATTIGNISDINDGDLIADSTYVEMPIGQWVKLTFRIPKNLLTDVGEFSAATPATAVNIHIKAKGETADSEMAVTFQKAAAGPTYYPTTTKGLSAAVVSYVLTLPAISSIDIKDYLECYLKIQNTSPDSSDMYLYNAYLDITGLLKRGVASKGYGAGGGVYVSHSSNGGGVNAYQTPRGIVITSRKDVEWDGNNLFASVIGRMF